MIKSNRKSEKSTRLITRKTDIWTNFIKFSSILVTCLAITLAGVKIPAKADDYSLIWYTSSQNPVSGSYTSATFLDSSLNNAYDSEDGKYSYAEYLISYNLAFTFTGFVTGYSYLYRPSGYLMFSMGSGSPITNYSIDSIELESFSYGTTNNARIEVIQRSSSNTQRYTCPFMYRFQFEWVTATASTATFNLNVTFRLRIYCANANAISLQALGQYNPIGTITLWENSATMNIVGAYIANFSPIEIDLAQYQQFLIANNYLDSIATAISPSSPPDPAVSEAETAASEAAELQSQEEEAFESFASDYDADEIDEVLETLDPLEIDDIGIATGLVFWKDWLNYHFNTGYEYGEHYNTVLSMVLNMIARLWH